MIVEIFDVEMGFCALVTLPDGKHIMVDCGHNTSTGWYPGDELARRNIERLDLLIITNYDSDHVSGLQNLRARCQIHLLCRNKSVSPQQIRELKRDKGMNAALEELVSISEAFCGPSQQFISPGFSFSVFNNAYSADIDDENNLSLVCSMSFAGFTFLFTGDMEDKGWEALLRAREDLRAILPSVTVLIAPHHGRENGFYRPMYGLFGGCMPRYTVISDKAIVHDTQNTTANYRAITIGGSFRNESVRRVLATRKDGNITFDIVGSTLLAY